MKDENPTKAISVACQTDASAQYVHLAELAICSRAQAPLTAAAAAVFNNQTSPSKDGCKPEGTLKLMIKNFHNMNDTVRGPGVTINGVPWKIMVMPRQHVMQKKGTQKCLGFFLQCCPEAYSDSWTCQASAELRLISQKAGVPNFTRKTTHNYSAKENDWGYSCFMTWADILDESQGYIKDDKVILEVYVKADPPKNVLTYDGFVKKIQDYMRLADMQSARGLIDKAIEVNQSAAKFCKDKDEASKALLDEQKKRLIDQKLKQSIERIEKGKSLPSDGGGVGGVAGESTADEGRDNMLAVRHALTGAGTYKPPAQQQAQTASAKDGSSGGKKAVKKSADAAAAKKEQPLVNGVLRDDKKSSDQQQQVPVANDDDSEAASTSGDEECGALSDDDEDTCDTCLQEQLDSIENKETVEVQCQTEPVPVAVANKTITKAAAAPASNGPVATLSDQLTAAMIAGDKQMIDEVQMQMMALHHHSRPDQSDDLSALDMAGNAAASEFSSLRPDQLQAMMMLGKRRLSEGGGGLEGSVAELAGNVQQLREAVKEQQLIDLITSESRSSLDSIRDTLERLVQLTQDGEAQPQLDFDLQTLRDVKRRGGGLLPGILTGGSCVGGHMDVIELPPPVDTPPDTDVVDLGNGDSVPVVVPKRQPSTVLAQSAVALEQQAQLQQYQRLMQQHCAAMAAAAANQQQGTDTQLTPDALAMFQLNDREELMVAKARAIVERRAEELVQKYTTLIEQSEATRLADTVRKVEQRMKDIERQTSSCRKELADECERHHKEETRLTKEIKTVKSELDKEKEKNERLTTQVRERKAEIKKMDKKVKQQETMSDELSELRTRNEQLDKDLENVRKEQRDERKKTQREKQQLLDAKKQLQQDLAASSAELETLAKQVEERTAAARKAEHRLADERKQNSASLRELLERARKSEVLVLEIRQAMALRTLTSAADESVAAAKHWETEARRYTAAARFDDAHILTTTAQEWRAVRERVQETITTTKRDYALHIENIRSGKATLAQLQSQLDMPKPPQQPKPPQLSVLLPADVTANAAVTTPKTTGIEAMAMITSVDPVGASVSPTATGGKPSIAPIGSARPAAAPQPPATPPTASRSPPALVAAPTALEQQQQPVMLQQTPVSSSSSRPSSVTATPVPMSSINLPATTSTTAAQHMQPAIVSQGSLRSSVDVMAQPPQQPYGGGVDNMRRVQAPPMGDRQQQMQQQPTATSLTNGHVTNPFNPWSDQFSIGDTLLRQHINGTGMQQPPQSAQAAPAQSIGAGWDQWAMGSQWAGGAVGWSGFGQDTKTFGAHSRGSSPATAGAHQSMPPPPPVGGGGAHTSFDNDPRFNELMKKCAMVCKGTADQETLYNICVVVFRQQLQARTDGQVNLQDAMIAVMSMVENNQNWGASVDKFATPPPALPPVRAAGPPVDTFSCHLCRRSLDTLPRTGAKAVTGAPPLLVLPKCKHRFHAECGQQWMQTHKTCPTCGVYNPCPNEYPELST